MTLRVSLPKPKKPKFFLRRVRGKSMLPALKPGQLIFGMAKTPQVGEVVIVQHLGREVIKRVKSITTHEVYVQGDNPIASTDSRDYGALKPRDILAVVIWPKV